MVLGVLYVLFAIYGMLSSNFDISSILLIRGSGVVLFFVPYLANLIRAERSFNANNILQEEIVYEFVGDKIFRIGASFKSEITCSKILKVKEV